MSAWAVTMGAGATMGSCMRRLPFHPKNGIGPKSITLTSEIAKHNSRDAYKSWAHLVNYVENVLQNFGEKYKIIFV